MVQVINKINTPEPIRNSKVDYTKICNPLIEIFTLQDTFQQKAMGRKDWWTIDELNGKQVDYPIAMIGEIGEGIDSLDFKWWSGLGEKDDENFITELVDALHFEISNTMKIFYSVAGFLSWDSIKLERNAWKFFTDLTEQIIKSNSNGYENIDQDIRLATIKEFVYQSLKKDRIHRKITLAQNIVKDAKKLGKNNYKSIFWLFEAAATFGIDFETIIKRYKVKNALNVVRKMNGYKEGTYEKMWVTMDSDKPQEDNKVALNIIGENETFEKTVEILNFYYETIMKKE